MNMYVGLRRIFVFLSILYWACAVKLAVVRAAVGFWPPGQDPMSFLACAALCYLVCFGFFWALIGFFVWPGNGC